MHRPNLTKRLLITQGLTHTVECRLLIYLLIYINISDSSNIVLHVDRYIRPSVDYLLFIPNILISFMVLPTLHCAQYIHSKIDSNSNYDPKQDKKQNPSYQRISRIGCLSSINTPDLAEIVPKPMEKNWWTWLITFEIFVLILINCL